MRRLSGFVAIGLVVAVSACAPRRVPPPAGGPAYPEYLFPDVPAGLGSDRTLESHQNGWNLLQGGDLGRSAREFSSILDGSPAFFPAEAGLGYVELARQEEEGALARFDRALALSTGYTPALVGKGQALLALKRDSEALSTFEAALAVNPTLADVRRRVDVLRFRAAQDNVTAAREAAAAGRYPDAIAAYERALQASPDSPLLYRELAVVEQQRGDVDRALEHARQALALDPSDVRALVLVGDLLEARGEIEAAIEPLAAAAAREPSEALDRRLASLRARAEMARMPAPYRAIGGAIEVTRGELAALVGVRLEPLLQSNQRPDVVVMTDTRGHWAASWIQSVARAGVMEVYPNHTFQPAAVVRRGDLAHTVSRVLDLVARSRPALVRQWQNARRKIADVSPGHLSYPAASVAVEAGVMPLLDGDTFRLAQPVSGSEATAAVDRLGELAGTTRTSGAR